MAYPGYKAAFASLCLTLVGCDDPDPATVPITPRQYAPSMPKLTVQKVTQPFVDQGFEVTEFRAIERLSWRCTKQKSTNVSLTVSLGGSAIDRIEEVDAAFLSFDKAGHDSEVQSFFAQVVRAAFPGKQLREAEKWVRENAGRIASFKSDGFVIDLGAGGNLRHMRIRWDPQRRRQGVGQWVGQ